MPNLFNYIQITIPFTKDTKIYYGGPDVQLQAIQSTITKATYKGQQSWVSNLMSLNELAASTRNLVTNLDNPK